MTRRRRLDRDERVGRSSPRSVAGSVSGRESQGEVTASLDALDVMSLSNKLLAGFARGRVETRRSQRQAYFAWRAHVREMNRLRARAEMVGSLYEKKWRQRLVTAWERRTSELRAKRRNQERMCLRVRQWRARWHWRRCALGFVRWRQLARKSAAGGELLERWARRWLNSAAARCVARWRAHVADIARMRTVARRVVRRMRAVKLSTAFDRWFKLRLKFEAVAGQDPFGARGCSKTTTRGAFRRWAHVAADARRRARDARRADVLFERRRRAFKADAFFAWSTYRFEKVSARYRFEKVSARWRRLERARPFRAWRESARRVREIRTHLRGTYLADLEHLRAPRRAGGSRGGDCGRRRRADAGWTPRPCSARSARVRGGGRSRASGRRRRRVRHVARRDSRVAVTEAPASRFANELNFAGRGVFVFSVARPGRRARVGAREDRRRRRQDDRVHADARVCSWAHATEAAWARRVKAARADSTSCPKCSTRKCLARLQSGKSASRIPGRRSTSSSGHERARALKAQNRALRVMSAWKGYTIRKAIGRSTREMADKMLRKKRMEAFLKKWRLEADWKDTVERRRLVSICRRRSSRREMSAMFARWRTYRRAEQRQRLAIARLVRASTYAAFATWRDFAAAQRAFLRRMEKVMRRWLRLSLSYPFERWIESVDERRRVRVVLQKCARRLANSTVAAAFPSWSAAVAKLRERGAAERPL